MGNSGSQQSPIDESLTYLCVTDVQITDQQMGRPQGHPMAGQATSGPKVQQMRMIGHVRQQDFDIPESTPVNQEKSPWELPAFAKRIAEPDALHRP